MSEFYQHFKEDMDALGLAAPETLFANATPALATATALATQIDKFGSKVTLMEIVGAGTRLEKLAVVGACSAAFYAGAVVGASRWRQDAYLPTARRWLTSCCC